jgi:hypothetical protein
MVVRAVAAVGCALIILVASAATSVAGPAAVDLRWAWVTARLPGATTAYSPAAIDQGNSTGSNNTVQFMGGLGRYHVFFGGVGVGGTDGVIHVTALGTAGNTCGIESWGTDVGGVLASIYCDDASGQPTTSRFTATFLATNATSGRLAYLLNSNAFGDSTPSAPNNYNSKSGTNTVDHSGPGTYVVTLPGLGSDRGDVQVTAFGTYGPPTTGIHPAGSPPASYCKTGWGPSGTDMKVQVYCFSSSGIRADTRFDLTFMQSLGLKGIDRTRVAYLWAARPSAASYIPGSLTQYSSVGQAPKVTRLGTGFYRVELPGMPRGGGAIVTATGGSARRCGVGSIRTDATPQRIQVRCYDFSNNPTDSKFTLAYER